MKGALLTVFSVTLINVFSFAQKDTLLLKKINTTLQQQQAHTKTAFTFSADSTAIENNTIKVFYNSSRTYQKGAIPSGVIEMLPELLMHLTHDTKTEQLLLLAKDNTGEWKTLDYFSNEKAAPAYTEPKNNDKFEPRVGRKKEQLRNTQNSTPNNPQGALTNKTVWLSPGHGWFNENGNGFTTQRGNNNELVEDFITTESINYYLTHYLYNAGANVWSVRERDVNTNEIIVDNAQSSASYIETGTWVDGTLPGFGGTYRVAGSEGTETATATFTPDVTQSGFYWVSVRYVSGANRTVDARYNITHSGATSTVRINQEVHGETWVYLGRYYFIAGASNKIVLSNQSSDVGQAVIADAVRLGGGIGNLPDCVRGGATSGKPRFEESARQYAPYQGYSTCNNDVVTRPFYAEWELAKGDVAERSNAVFVSWHTNAGGGTGTETYSYNGLGSSQPNITPGSVDLRNFIHNQVVADIKAGWKSTWGDRGVKTANFGELRELRIMPGTLLELAFHDLAADANELKHPDFRKLASRAIYKGIVKFFNNRDNTPLIFLPEEPTNVYAKNIGSSQIQISWAAPASGGILGNAATGYKVYVSRNGKSFSDGISTTNSSYTFTGSVNTTYYFKVTATNAGGESFSTSVVAARTPASSSSSVGYLIVDGFDRLDRSALIPKFENATLGTVKRMFLERMNRKDYMIEHAEALANCNRSFDGCQNEAVSSGNALLLNYNAVDWYTGEESTVDKSLDSTEKAKLKTYLDSGGNLIISGADLGWDLGRSASANADLNFYNNYLKANFLGDDANTYDFSGTSNFFVAQNGVFDNSTAGYYDVDFPDRISATTEATEILQYSGGTADGAAVGYLGNYRLIYLSFPFEAITSATVRNNLMCNAVAFLSPALPVKDLTLKGESIGKINRLFFETTGEINIKHFQVERSSNGIMFNPIGTPITATGSASQGSNYAYEDKDHPTASYYRIKAVDIDGKFYLSNVIYLKEGQPNALFRLAANPVTANIVFDVFATEGINISLYNNLGQKVYNKNVAPGNARFYTIPVQSLSKGMYSLTITSNTERQTEKVVIQ